MSRRVHAAARRSADGAARSRQDDVLQFGGTGQSVATIPEFLWELSLGIYLTVRGFRRSPILAGDTRQVGAS